MPPQAGQAPEGALGGWHLLAHPIRATLRSGEFPSRRQGLAASRRDRLGDFGLWRKDPARWSSSLRGEDAHGTSLPGQDRTVCVRPPRRVCEVPPLPRVTEELEIKEDGTGNFKFPLPEVAGDTVVAAGSFREPRCRAEDKPRIAPEEEVREGVRQYERQGELSTEKTSSRNENNTQKGRCAINYDTQRGVLSITIEKLTVQDTGEYWCALNDDSYFFQIKEVKLAVFIGLRMAMELRVLLLLPLCFPGLQAQTPAAKERRLEGSTLYIWCPYTAQTNSQQRKAWCRMRENRCEPLVETTNPSQYPYKTHATNGKVTIEDNPTHRTVSITMANLQVEDSGTYCCASRFYSNRYLPLKTISLNVFKELHKPELYSLSVQCPYSILGYSRGTKAWCRREGQTGYKVVVSTDYSSTRHNSKAMVHRTLIQDDTQQRTVTITLQELQAQDTGTYFCVLYRSSPLTPIMEVRLSVSKRYLRTPQQGRVTIQDDTQQGIVTITMEKLQAQDSGVYCSNVNSCILLSGVLSVLFILALISMITLCVRRCKQLKKRGTRQAENIYDKPEDIAQLDSTERMESPKDDSKDLKYVTLNFKSRLSLEDPLYCNVEPSQTHRKPKDENVEYAIIALKQLPMNDKG
ncbi:PREDICTED: LOW QUALITY PROTEIN: uncharacterized protein LOC103919870 [Pygoscelis adeliae]|uniref:LOW QUALITY PROTEIN: uncharacterized protein LOC103919870 n=1 Tax=Pygoscelis adeliae TaxID=9238 RepID=UPI0004F4DAEE|nr:PREDICTED: LOW QUALITY PROTEIN: uncharacterized protein LOC103919870 [Pygoscelis adeliae]